MLARGSALPARVVSRHLRGAVVLRNVPTTDVRVLYSDGGIISAADVARLLRSRFGSFVKVEFALGLKKGTNVIPWTALTSDGRVIDGRLALHAEADEDRVVCWASLQVQPPRADRTAAKKPGERLDTIDRRVRALIRKLIEEPSYRTPDVVADLVRVVDLADGDGDEFQGY